MRVNNTRESVYRAADALFERFRTDYREIDSEFDAIDLIDYLSGPAKVATFLEYMRAIKKSVDINLRQRENWRKRSVGKKIADLILSRTMDKEVPPVSLKPNISNTGYLLHQRVLEGQLSVAGRDNYDTLPVRVIDSYLDGTLIVVNDRFELEPEKRQVRVDLNFPHSKLVKYDLAVSYLLYPDIEHIQVKKSPSLAPVHPNLQLPFYPGQPNLYQQNMIYAINGLEKYSQDQSANS